jgi:hypothetical protein
MKTRGGDPDTRPMPNAEDTYKSPVAPSLVMPVGGSCPRLHSLTSAPETHELAFAPMKVSTVPSRRMLRTRFDALSPIYSTPSELTWSTEGRPRNAAYAGVSESA